MARVKTITGTREKRGLREQIAADYKKNKYILFMAIPVFLWFVIFCYLPIFGIIIAFKDYSPGLGILASPWAGLRHFKDFLASTYTLRIFKNTLLLNLYGLLWGFPAPILLALLLNEVRHKTFKVGVQILSYMPYFISMVVVCGIVVNFTERGGLISQMVGFFSGEDVNLLLYPKYYRSIYIASDLWQQVGWGSIIYMAALAGIDPSLYEAATMDGAGRLKQTWHVTIPGIMPTIIILLIWRMGSVLNSGFEKTILLYNESTYDVADTIGSYTYRRGMVESNYSFSSTVGLFNSLINMMFLVAANKISKQVTESSLW